MSATIHCQFRQLYANRTVRKDALSHRHSLIKPSHTVLGTVHDPVRLRFLGIQNRCCEDQFLGFGSTNQARQPLSSTRTKRRVSASLQRVTDTYPGKMANRVSTRPILAFGPAMRISQANAISMPPPTAVPSKAAIVGIGNVYKRKVV